MKVFGKPENRWGWVRVTAYVVLVSIVAWSTLAAGLKGIGDISWMAWSGYQAFSLFRGLELALIALLVAFTAGWLEEYALRKNSELTRHREAEHALAAQRKEAVRRLREAIRAVLPAVEQTLPEVPVQIQVKLTELVRAVLDELDEKGKGEVLHILFEHKLLAGEKPAVGLQGANFRRAVLPHAHLSGICLDEIDLSNAKMNGAHLARARLSGAVLSRAFLQHADLRGAVLNGANLSGVNLEGANLEGADLRNVCLKDAFLRNTNLEHCALDTLDQAILIDTLLPDGRKVTNENGKQYLRDKEFSMLIDKL